MENVANQNKVAWEYKAYEFWVEHGGTPLERAQAVRAHPREMLKKYGRYFGDVQGLRIANICGSCGKKAVPLAVLGAQVTIFDLSEDNRRYAMETAQAAEVPLDFVLCDIMEIDLSRFGSAFDLVFMEGGVLHYFHDLLPFMTQMAALLKPGGTMICSDFHPFLKVSDYLQWGRPSCSYFSTEPLEVEMPHAKFYPEEERKKFPMCSIRRFTLSEIVNSVLCAGFTLKRFDEHPAWTEEALPGEFTLVAEK